MTGCSAQRYSTQQTLTLAPCSGALLGAAGRATGDLPVHQAAKLRAGTERPQTNQPDPRRRRGQCVQLLIAEGRWWRDSGFINQRRRPHGRHATALPVRSTLTAGPCSNSLHPTVGGSSVRTLPVRLNRRHSICTATGAPGEQHCPTPGTFGPRRQRQQLRQTTAIGMLIDA